MARQRYIGVIDPQAAFRRYAVWRDDLTKLRLNCFPMQADYLALDSLMKALDATATHFTGEADFYKRVSVPFSMIRPEDR